MAVTKSFLRLAGLAGAAALISIAGAQAAEKPFGGPDSVGFAKQLWTALEKAHYVGKGQMRVKPYKGTEPHGFVLETIEGTLTMAGRTGRVIVKRNYGPKGVAVDAVNENRAKHLAAVTVMFKRETGYDPADKDWFWVKYQKDGSIEKNPKGASLAGRVAKGMDAGCIACHSGAPGGDMVFAFDGNN